MAGRKYGPNSWLSHGFKRHVAIYFSVLLSTTGYGISFPLLSISLESMGISGQLIGINAAMPALGWLIGSFFLPGLLARFGLKQVLIACLLTAGISISVFPLTQNLMIWMLLRFLFGGSLGLFYRAVEFWINAVSENATRGRNIGLYSFCFVLGLAVGSSVQPLLGISGILPFAAVSALLALTVLVVAFQSHENAVNIASARSYFRLGIVLLTPIALMAVFAYGFFEDILAYLMAVYALRNNLGESVAAFTITAMAIGNLTFPIPIGHLSDRIDRTFVLIACALVVTALSIIIPQTVSNPPLFLAVLVVWSGLAGSIYTVALSMIGDRFSGAELAVANASFGIVYAFGGLIGPVVNGYAIDQLHSQGLMVSAAATFGIFVILATAVMMKDRKYAG